MLIQKEKFFPSLDFILPELQATKLYSNKEFNEKFPNDYGTWPGYRSENLPKTNKSLSSFFMYLLQEIDYFKGKNCSASLYLHLRTPEDEKDEWIHIDSMGCDMSVLVYLNETNLNSGTYLYNDNKQVINDIKYVQNRFVAYKSNYKHKGYGYFGNNTSNGRLTLNAFVTFERGKNGNK